MKLITSFFIGLTLLIFNYSFGQQLEIAPLTQNRFETGKTPQKAGGIDSSFLFTTDTVSIPFFDDFTTNKIQNYNPDFSNPQITSSVFYYLIDQATDLPIDNGIFLQIKLLLIDIMTHLRGHIQIRYFLFKL